MHEHHQVDVGFFNNEKGRGKNLSLSVEKLIENSKEVILKAEEQRNISSYCFYNAFLSIQQREQKRVGHKKGCIIA